MPRMIDVTRKTLPKPANTPAAPATISSSIAGDELQRRRVNVPLVVSVLRKNTDAQHSYSCQNEQH